MKRDDWGVHVDDPTPYTVESQSGQYLHGVITYITDGGIVIIIATHRRRLTTLVRRHKKITKLMNWEEVRPPRKMLAVGGRIVGGGPDA